MTVDEISPLLSAIMNGDGIGIDQLLDRFTDEEIAYLCDMGRLLELKAGLKLSSRLATKAEILHHGGEQ